MSGQKVVALFKQVSFLDAGHTYPNLFSTLFFYGIFQPPK